MKRISPSLAILAVLRPALAIIDPTAPATPCVPSRSVDAAIQTGIALGCQADPDITEAVCSDYLAQEILTAISYFCGNQTEAFHYCTSLPNVSVADCQGSDPSGGGVGPDCTQAAVNAYNNCGTSSSGSSSGTGGTGGNLFAAGDPVSLSQCLFYDLGLCTPEDGEGHFNAVYTGAQTDCPIPSYTPACGVYSTSGPAPTTPAPPTSSAAAASSPSSSSSLSSSASSSSSLSSAAPSSAAPSSAAPSSAAPSSQTTQPEPPLSTASAAPPTSAPTAPPRPPPPGASPYFHLTLNGSFTHFVGPAAAVISDPAQAQVFYVLDGQLFTSSGLRVQAAQGPSPSEPAPYVPLLGSQGALPFSTNFSLVRAGINPSSSEKRQIVGQAALYWTNAAFAAPGPTALFCVYQSEVYAVLQAAGLGADFSALCVSVALDAIYIPYPGPASSSSASAATPTALTATTASASASSTFSIPSCPIGQTLFAYTTVYR